MPRPFRARIAVPVLALTVVGAGTVAAVGPSAQDGAVAAPVAFERFYPPQSYDLAAPLDSDLRRTCGCITDAFAVVPSTFDGGAGGPVRPPARALRQQAGVVVAAVRGSGTPGAPVEWEPENGLMLGMALLAAPDLMGVDRTTGVRLAVHHLARAARAGHGPAEGELGYLYLVGEGVRQSDAQAAYWFDRSARGGFAPAQVAIGAMFLVGRGVERDDRTALAWFRKAGEDRLVGDAYACGVGVPESLETARTLYEQAHDPDALTRLAGMYGSACGVGLDDTKALALYEEAAQAGAPAAQVAFAELQLRTSKEGPPNPFASYLWAELAYERVADGELRRRAADVRAAADPLVPGEGKYEALRIVKALKEAAEPQRPGSR